MKATAPCLRSVWILAFLAVCSSAVVCFGGTTVWTGVSGTDWSTPGNWDPAVPVATDDVFVTNGANNPVLNSSTPALNSLVISNMSLTFANWSTVLDAGTVTVKTGGVFTLTGSFTTSQMSNRVNVSCTDFTIEPGGQIDADGHGFYGANGPGAGPYITFSDQHGGGYGGKGGGGKELGVDVWGGRPYGSASAPLDPGSGGGAYGDSAYIDQAGEGGGAVRIAASGTVTVQGTISANGTPSVGNNSGGGSGGGIYITCATFGGSATGLIRAEGGGTYTEREGSGGGGRIAVDYSSLAASHNARFSAAPGATGWYYGDIDHRAHTMPMRGTLWLPDTELLSTTLDNTLFAGAVNIVGISSWAPASLTVSNCDVTFGEDGVLVDVANETVVDQNGSLGIGTFSTGTNYTLVCRGSLTLTNGGSLYAFSGRTNGGAHAYGARVAVSNDLIVRASSWVYPFCNWTNGGAPLFIMDNLVIDTNGGFNACTRGFQPAVGPGSVGHAGGGCMAGASHGGSGGYLPADSVAGLPLPPYGSTQKPTVPGSGGSTHDAVSYRGGAGGGGGVVWAEASGTITVRGTIKADGGMTYLSHRSGGAGGAVYLKCDTFGGTADGLISADGGKVTGTTVAAGGGGGRIALDYQNVAASHAVCLSTRSSTAEWSDMSDNRWYMHSRRGTLWLPDGALLSANLVSNQFREVNIVGLTSWSVDSLTVSNCSLRFAEDQVRVTVANDIQVGADGVLGLGRYSEGTNYFLTCGGNLVLTNGGQLDICSGETDNPTVTNYGALVTISNTLAVGPSSWVYTYAHETDGGTPLIRASNVVVQAGGGFNANARGYSVLNGPGVGVPTFGSTRGGGGYGGAGGGSAEAALGGISYGSIDAPIDPGSGGDCYYHWNKSGANGGGSVRIDAGGTVTIRGSISANGADTPGSIYAGGGSGGGIHIKCDTFGGSSGVIEAKGGNPSSGATSGGGGGGRIAIDYQQVDASHDVRFSAAPAAMSWAYADLDHRWRHRPVMGTLSLPNTALLPNPVLTSAFADDVFIHFTGTKAWNLDSLTVSNCTVAFAESEFDLNITNDLLIGSGGDLGIGGDPDGSNYVLTCGGNMLLTNSGSLYAYAGLSNGAANAWGARVDVGKSMTVAPGSWVYPESHGDNGGSAFFRVSNLVIRAGAGFNASGKGFNRHRGPGKGADYGGASPGAGYGGKGGHSYDGNPGGVTYGLTNGPAMPGSGGGGYLYGTAYHGLPGSGGGLVRLDADIMRIEGTLEANGGDGWNYHYAGAGSGGGIYITASNFSGSASAVIEAKGGDTLVYTPRYPGGGGGGRIAIWLNVPENIRTQALAGVVDPGLTELALLPNYDGEISVTNGLGATVNPAQPGTKRYLRMSAGDAAYLQISGKPDNTYGSPQPLGYGTHLDIAVDTAISNFVATPADEVAGTRHACIGWDLKTVESVLVSNKVNNVALFELYTNLVLTWHWTNEYLLTASYATPTNGNVNSFAVNGWYTNLQLATGILASPSSGWAFASWDGDVPPENALDNPLTLTMTQARNVQPTFIPLVIETKVWSGSGSWTNGANWTPSGVPSTLDTAIIGSGTCRITKSTYAGSLIVSNGATLMFTNWMAKAFITKNVTVMSNGTITLPPFFSATQMSNRVNIACSNLTVEAGGRIDADGKGFGPYDGPGHGNNYYYGGGGGYGGTGGRAYPESNFALGRTYGSVSAPLDPGSGGGSYPGGDSYKFTAGSGGGAIRIHATGTVTIDGTVSASGSASTGQYGAGGSGGCVYITCRELAGNGPGVVRVTGGGVYSATYSAGGGGGRIAVDYDELALSHAVQFSAAAATIEYAALDSTNRWMHAAKNGSLWLPDTALLAGSAIADQFQGVTLTIQGVTSLGYDSLTISNCWFGFADANFELMVTNTLTIESGGSLMIGAYQVKGANYALKCGGDLVLTNGGKLYLYSGEADNPGQTNGILLAVTDHLRIGPSSWIYARSHPTNATTPLFAVNDLTIEAGGGIDAIGGGYQWNLGPGTGPAGGTYNGGAGYGGKGGGGVEPWFGGGTYGSLTAPTQPGSGGRAHSSYLYSTGSGGGAVRIDAAGTVTVRGTIAADGSDALHTYGSAGSGGAIYIRCDTLGGTSSGLLAVRGGDPYDQNSGGGGGGRIALDYQNLAVSHAIRFAAGPGPGSWAFSDTDNHWQHVPQAGTIYLPDTTWLTDSLTGGTFDGGRLYFPGSVTWRPDSLTVDNCTLTLADSDFQLIVTNDILITGNGALGIGDDDTGTNYVLRCGGDLTVTNGGALYVHSGMTNGVGTNYGTLADIGGTLTVRDNCWVYPISHPSDGGTVLFQAGDVLIGTNAGFNASSKGYPGRSGPGKGATTLTYASGAGHGGRGGDANLGVSGGAVYGSTNYPTAAGSGGGSYNYYPTYFPRAAAGGGAVRIEAERKITLNGSLVADGGKSGSAEYGGGGSGGSVHIDCDVFRPRANSVLSAIGGEGFGNSGGGGGGRIAVWAALTTSDRARLQAGLLPANAVVTNDFAEFALLSLSVTNGAGFASPNLAEPGTAVYIDGRVAGSMILVR